MVGHDPLVDAKILEQNGVKPVKEIREAFRGVDGVIIMTNHLKYRDAAMLDYAALMNKPALFFDPWHIFKPQQILARPGLHYGNLGFSSFLNDGRNGFISGGKS
jgi:UDP-N-acetyl-D-mannosaminuronate dehydrogenase